MIAVVLYLLGIEKYWIVLGLLPLAKLNLAKIDGIKARVLLPEDQDVLYLLKKRMQDIDPMLVDQIKVEENVYSEELTLSHNLETK